MPIQEANIVFVESQVMDDVPEGGGAMTGRVIVDGQMNNVFEDISDLDRAYGRFNLRKIAVAVRTLDTDLFGGAKSVITELPEDSAIGYALFSTPDPFDTRTDAANRVEAYLFKGPTYAGYLHENHIVGMRAINILQRVGTALPPIGKTLCLVQNEGLAGESEQYVRVIGVGVTERTFTDNQGDYQRWEVRFDISDALRFNFNGHEANRFDTLNYTNKTRLRDTNVADATKYHGSQYTTLPANVGDLTARVSSIFAPLVPSAQAETPLANQPMNPELAITIVAGTRTVDVVNAAHTLARTVTVENRRLNWIETLAPIPAPNGCSLAFRAQGNWYVLVDNGAGVMEAGDPSIGIGTLNYETGSLAVTLGALPDVGSQIMIAWGSPVHTTVRAGATSAADTAPEMTLQALQTPIAGGSVIVTWLTGATPKTATATMAGALTGDATGDVNLINGTVALRFNSGSVPNRDGSMTLQYDWDDPDDPNDQLVKTITTTTSTTIVPESALTPGGVVVGRIYYTTPNGSTNAIFNVRDNGLGSLVYKKLPSEAFNGEGYKVDGDQVVGSVNYATGTITLNAELTGYRLKWDYQTGAWVTTPATYQTITNSAVPENQPQITYKSTTVIATTREATEVTTVPNAGLRIDITATTTDAIIPGSVRFAFTGKSYDDRSGTLYTDIDPNTGSGLPAGTIDYETGICTITFWANNAAANISVSSCLTIYGDWTAVDASFRASLSPLKPESLQVTATTLAGAQISGTADADGLISTGQMIGSVNYEFGTATVEFGAMGDDPDYVGDAPIPQVWIPLEVLPSTIRYNAVAFSYIPLDADILGIDPVRLPPDGRVPIYRKGDIALAMHTAETATYTVTNGQTINCNRTRIGWIRVIDATGASVAEGFELDRATGIVTFTNVTGIAMPVKVRHTVADLRMLTDVQITGDLTFSRPLSHAYPAGQAVIGSCLIQGDRRARVSAVWDQATWNGTWVDNLVGSEATATLDTIAHPIVVTNEGAETERWVLRWTSTSNVELIGQRRGLVFAGPYTADIAPINPRTRAADGTGGVPYLQIPLAANGGGWSTGNVVRINTVGAIAPMWIARAIQQSDEPLDDGADGCEMYCLGNIDRP